MSFVKTPSGVVMHAVNHAAAVERAKKYGLKSMLLLLEPAEPIEESTLFLPDLSSAQRAR